MKTVNMKRIKENFESLKVDLDALDMKVLNSINKRFRFIDHRWGCRVDQEVEELWDDEFLG